MHQNNPGNFWDLNQIYREVTGCSSDTNEELAQDQVVFLGICGKMDKLNILAKDNDSRTKYPELKNVNLNGSVLLAGQGAKGGSIGCTVVS